MATAREGRFDDFLRRIRAGDEAAAAELVRREIRRARGNELDG